MKRWNILILVLVGLLAISLIIAGRRSSSVPVIEKDINATAASNAKNMRSPVLVELFTSEGCSSCPPADELLTKLEKEQPVPGAEIIVLSQHVDYWNSLGWSDPYSSSSFSERQSGYAEAFKRDGVYTPQMIVDGRAEFVGNNPEKAREAISSAVKAQKAMIEIRRVESAPAGTSAIPLNISIENLPALSAGDSAEVLMAVTENDLHSSVSRGENSGRRLNHTAVVRELDVIGSIQEGVAFKATPTINLSGNWKSQNLRAVVFVQERLSRRVLGAAVLNLAAK